MKKFFKMFGIILLLIIILLIINFIRNTLIINKTRELGKHTLEKYPEKVILTTTFNNEISTGEVDKINALIPEEISNFDKIFHIIVLEENYYIIKNKDVKFYVNKNTGIIYKDIIEKMNTETIYQFNI